MKTLRNIVAVACAIGSFLVHADAVKIRLQFVFDAGAMDYISQAGANYDDFAASCVTRMNTVLANSRLTGYYTYELACTTLLPGVDNTNPATGYTEGWAALNGNRGSEWAGMLQDRYNNAADVVVLLINTGTYAGATGNSHPYTGTGAEYAINYAGSAFSVCSIMTAAREIEGIASAHQVVSHEVAHTIGCGHPDTQDRQPGPQSATYASGLQFKLPTGKETALPRSASVTRDLTAYYGTTLMGYSERFFKNVDGTYMTCAEVLAETGWTDADEGEKYWDNTDGSYGTGYPNGVWAYCYIVPYFSSPNLYFSTVTVPYGQEVTSGVVTVYDQAQYDAMSAEDKAKVVPMGDATHNNRQVLIDNCQYASKWHLGVKFSKDGSESVVNGKSDKITLTPLSKNLTIYYTTDGTEPTKSNGTLYTKPFSLTQAATVKARSYDSSDNAGDVLSKSYTMLPLATALDNTELTWTTSSPEWYANNGVARSGNINSDGVSSTLSTVIKGPAKLTFDYVAELMDNDVFTVTVGGNEVFRHTGYLSAQTPSGDIVIPAGEQTVEFTCTVNFSMGYGMNHVNLYDVSVTYDYDPDAEEPEDPEEPSVAAPVPAAVWENDFSSEALAGFEGISIEDWNETHGENNSSVTIDRNNQGLFVDFTEAKGYVTVLVKYSDLSASQNYKRVLFATTPNDNHNYDRCGIRLQTDGKVIGLWNGTTNSDATSDADYGSASTATVPSAGTLAFVYDKGSSGTSAYVAGSGESLPSAALWNNTALKAGDIYGFAVGGMCRGASASGVEAAKGMTITGLAVFTSVLSVAEMNAYVWPSEEPEAPPYEGPAPTAVWVAGEFGDDRSAHAGLDVALNGNTTNALGQIVIANDATTGATIALPAATHQKMSMLVKYSIPSGGAPAANSVPASMFSTYDLGARAAQAASSALDGYWLNGSIVAGGYDFSTPAQTIPQEGYILISNWATNANPDDHGTAVYTGETLATLSGGEKSGLRFTGANNYITSVGIGGPTVAGAVPWTGMVIESVALFDEWVTTNVIANYTFPAQGAVQPVDTDRYAIEPVVSWVNDFKTAKKGDYTLSVSGTTAAKDDTFGGTLTIGNAAAVIDTTAADSAKMTVLIKYRAASSIVSAPVVAFGGMASSGTVGLDVGVYTKADKTLAVYRNFSADNGKPYDFATAPILSANGGYVLCARDNVQACMAYVGDSLDSMAGAELSSGTIKFSNVPLTKLGIGGNSSLTANANDMVPFTGFEVEKVVVFNGYYTPADLTSLNIKAGETKSFTAGETQEYPTIGTLSSSGTIAIANASTLAEGSYKLAEWTTPKLGSNKYGQTYGAVGALDTTGLPAGLTAELVYGAKAIYLRVYDADDYAARPKLKLMPYGDSITEGYNGAGTKANYRVLLAQKLALLGYNVEMVGCFDKIQTNNSNPDSMADAIDPSGATIPDAWKWHSAKHGGTVGITSVTSYQRSAMVENVDTIAAQAGSVDAVLLHGGINDLSVGSVTANEVFVNWTNTVWRLLADLPDAKIIVSTTLYATYGNASTLNPKSDTFNNLVKAQVSKTDGVDDGAFPAGRVLLADLNSYVKSGDAGVLSGDGLHPDWWGHDQMAEGWLSVITNVYPSANGTFPSETPLPEVDASELGAAAKDELADYIDGFKLCRTITPTANIDTANPYSATGDGATEEIEKVAYFVEYVRADNNAHKWVWVDMDAFGDDDLASVGLPAANRQQVVTKLHVKSNHNGIEDVAADDDTVEGWIEFSPFGYGGAASGVSGAPTAHGGNDKSMYDWNDTLSASGSMGCMQVFRTAPSTGRPAQVLFAYNNWRDATSEAEFGIGNFAQHFWGGAQTLDYTYTKGLPQMNAAAYSVKRIEIWTKTAEPEGPATLPGLDTNVEMEVSEVTLDSTREWAQITDTPIYLTLGSPVGRFYVSFDVDIPENVYGTLFSWDSQKGTTTVDSRVVVTNDAAKMVIWRKADGTLSTVDCNSSTLIPSGQHHITVSWVHNSGCTITVDGETYYSSTNLKFSDYDTTKFAIGGSALGDPDDVLAGLKVKNFRYVIYPSYITRLDGTVLHDNDANRAIITNYLSQIDGTRPLTPPAPHTVDVLLVYDKPSTEYVSDLGESLDVHGAKGVAVMNKYLIPTDMDTNFWFRLVGTYSVNETLTVENGFGWAQASAEVTAVREKVGADVVLTIVCSSTGGLGGLAWRNNPAGIKSGSEKSHTYAAVLCGYRDTFAWVHEVGHLTSLYHSTWEASNTYHDGSYVGAGFGGKVSEADGFSFGTVMGGGYDSLGFSSINHLFHGSLYSIQTADDESKWLDSTGVLNELMPYVANYYATKIPETPTLSITPENNSVVVDGAKMEVSFTSSDPEVTIWYSADGGVTETRYEGPVEIDAGSFYGMYGVYIVSAKKGEDVIETKMVTYHKSGVNYNHAEVLDSGKLPWAMEGTWTKDESVYSKGASSYKCDGSTAGTYRLATSVTVEKDSKLVFHRMDAFSSAAFIVWVDGKAALSLSGASDTNGEWVESSVDLSAGSHVIEFVFSQISAVAGSFMRLDDVSISGIEKYTDTDYPVPYSWFLEYGVPEGYVTTIDKSEAANGENKWWECYVLGLNPTDSNSKFIVTIRMDGTTPVIEYAPTNEVLKASGAIRYVLQGSSSLKKHSDWTDADDREDMTTDTDDRFFRVKVEWGEE